MANYAVVLYPDKKGMIRLMNLMSGSLMVDFRIKPHITLAVCESFSELRVKYYYKKLAQSLRPARLYYHNILRSVNDVISAESKRSENLNHDLKIVDAELFPRFKKAGTEGSLDDWVPLTAVAYKVESVDMGDYARYVSRVFRAFECSATTAALVRLDPYTELLVTKLRRPD